MKRAGRGGSAHPAALLALLSRARGDTLGARWAEGRCAMMGGMPGPRIGLAQIDARGGDRDTPAKVVHWCRRGAESGSDVVVLPATALPADASRRRGAGMPRRCCTTAGCR